VNQEKQLLSQRENLVFERFLNRCDEAHQGALCLTNPFKALADVKKKSGSEGDSSIDPCKMHNAD